MADDRAYRVVIRFDPQSEKFTASVPELELSASAETREAAVAAVESELDSRLQAAVDGEILPPPADVAEVSGAIELSISHGLHRELLHHATLSGISVEALAAELIARGAGALEGVRAQRRPRREDARPEEAPRRPEGRDEDQPPRRNEGQGRGEGRGDRRRREGYRPELEDKANFLEYLRNLEKGGGGGGRGRGRR